MFDQFPLDLYRRGHGRIALGEYGKHAVSGLLDDGSTEFADDRSNDVIMEFDNLVGQVIAKLIENFRLTDHIGEHEDQWVRRRIHVPNRPLP